MILASCPRCSETVRFPETELPSDAQARCPWCQESFSAKDWSAQLPPMVDLFDGAGIPIDIMAVAATGASLAATSVFDDEPLSNQVDMGEEAMEEVDMDNIDSDEVDMDEVDMDELDELHTDDEDQLDRVSEFEDDVASTVINRSAETWTDDDEPTEHHRTAQDTVAFEEEIEEEQQDGFDIVDEDAEADDEYADAYDEVSDEAFSATKDISHDFRIEEDDAPLREPNYDVLSEEPRKFDSARASVGIAPMRVKSKSRVNSKRSNLRTLLGVALGPVIALPIAGILFYMMGIDLGFWPLDGGRSAAMSARAAKPMDLDHFDPKTKSDSTLTSPSESNDPSASNILPKAMPESIDGATPQETESATEAPVTENSEVSLDRSFWAPAELEEETANTESKVTPSTDDNSSLSQPLEESATDKATAPSLELPIESTPEIVSSSKPDQDKTTELEMPELGSSPTVETTPSELSLAIADANQWLETLTTLSKDSENWKSSLAKTYAAIAKIGDSEPAASDKQLSDLIGKLKKSAHLNDLAAATALWLLYPKRTNDGAILVGRPGSSVNGPIITLPSGEEVSIRTNSFAMPTAEKVIAVGRIEGQSPQIVVRIVAVQPVK